MRRLACVLVALALGCGDNGGGAGGSGGSGGSGGTDGGAGTGGTGGTGGSGGMPDAGPPAGTRISSTGGTLVLVNKAQDQAAWLDMANQAHVAPLNMGANPTAINFPFADLLANGAMGWVNNTLLIDHGLDTANGVGKIAVWTTGMTAALDVTTELNGVGATARPIGALSPDGTQLMFVPPGTAAATADIKMQAVMTGSTPVTLVAGLPAAGMCGVPLGNWASWNSTTNTGTLVLLACDAGTTMGIKLKKVAIAGGTGTPTNISQAGDSAIAFSLSVNNMRQIDGKYVAYVNTATPNQVRIVNLMTGAVIGSDTVLTVTQTSPFPIGTFQGNDLFYLAPNDTVKKMTVNAQGTATTTATVITGAKDWAGSSFDGNSFSPDASKFVYYTAIMTAGNFTFGTMKLANTNGTGTPLTLNSDVVGYPGDNVFSKNGTYVFWYDMVDTTTTGIGRILTRKVDGSDQQRVIGPLGYFVRQTNDDNIVAVMANSHFMNNVTTGDLLKVTLSDGMSTKVVDQITYMDLTYPTAGAQVVYTRRDGVYITPLP